MTIFDVIRYPVRETDSGLIDYEDIRKLPNSIWDKYDELYPRYKHTMRGTDLLRKLILEWNGEPDDDI